MSDDECLEGPPEFVVEISSSTESIDLHAKLRDYERAGVCEYLVVAIRHQRILWFELRDGKFEELNSGEDGIHRSNVLPGL